jgi:hypothetical protein
VGAAFQPRIKTIAAGKPLPQNPIHLFFPDNRIIIFSIRISKRPFDHLDKLGIFNRLTALSGVEGLKRSSNSKQI